MPCWLDSGKAFDKRSCLLTKKLDMMFFYKCLGGKRFTVKLLYKKSEDSSGPAGFHKKCDGIPNTITVIRTKGNGAVIGGFTDLPWESHKLTV
jgi:hypothetical protein